MKRFMNETKLRMNTPHLAHRRILKSLLIAIAIGFTLACQVLSPSGESPSQPGSYKEL
jgi:hypothetical protein